jgi:Cys-tRNA(Pro) deacylase
MSVESVRNYFIERNLQDPVFELSDSGATVELAAKTLGIEPKLVAKTLAFRLKDRDILIVIRGDSRIDNKKYKKFFELKAKMLDYYKVEDITGHPVGGVCPFGLRNPLDIYLDISLEGFEYIYPAAGSKTTALKISPKEMQQLTNAVWIDIS